MNTADPGVLSPHWGAPGPRSCDSSETDTGCAYDYGWNAASEAFSAADAQTHAAATVAWWLDIETLNTWLPNTAMNAADVQGMLDFFHGQSVTVGIYASSSQWLTIAGSFTIDVPNWVPGAADADQATSWCSPAHSVTGGPVTLVQYPAGAIDGDVRC
jgi:hypothetical protein